jgi:TrpR-related protein YerC/YecD
MDKKYPTEVDELFDAILSLNSREECYMFFEDALTYKEILDIAQRLKAAKLLNDKTSYVDVCKITGMSTATISRVSKALDRGAGGYKLVMERIEGKND